MPSGLSSIVRSMVFPTGESFGNHEKVRAVELGQRPGSGLGGHRHGGFPSVVQGSRQSPVFGFGVSVIRRRLGGSG